MKYSAIIIDDEVKAIEGLKVLLEYVQLPIEIIDTANNGMDGLRILKNKKPDIVFLDIEMPNITGFDFLELADKKDKYFIFISAHEEYALKAIKNDINDYLLKPVSVEDLKRSLEKAIKHNSQLSKEISFTSHSKISISTSKGTIYKPFSDIIYIKAKKRYSEIVCTDGSSHLVCKNIGEFEHELQSKKFFRVHKSFLVNTDHANQINKMDGGFLEVSNGDQIEISQRKKNEFVRFMNS